MDNLNELLKRLQMCELAYKNAKSSLDNSNELIIAKEKLKEARWDWLTACEEYVLQNPIIPENPENVYE